MDKYDHNHNGYYGNNNEIKEEQCEEEDEENGSELISLSESVVNQLGDIKINVDNTSKNNNNSNLDNPNKTPLVKSSQINQSQSNKAITNEIIQLEILNFIEIFIHNILYLRQVYPKQSFYSYSIYSLDFLHFMPDPEISEYISSFLSSIENFFITKSIKAIHIMLIDSSINKVIELFTIDLSFSELWFELTYEELCLQLKTVLSQFYYHYCNKAVVINMNMTFDLAVETKDMSIIKGKKIYDDITNTIQNKYVHNVVTNDLVDVFKNKTIVASFEEGSLEMSITHSHI